MGDEFQAIPKTMEIGIKIIFEIEESIVKQKFNFQLRYILNFGKIDTKINTQIAYEMPGAGRTVARNELNN